MTEQTDVPSFGEDIPESEEDPPPPEEIAPPKPNPDDDPDAD